MELLFDGHKWPDDVFPDDLDWDKAWVDSGPSPAGNVGFYLHVPHKTWETIHRIYFKKKPIK